MRGHCEHCANPMKEFWTTQCMYRGDYLTHHEFVKTSLDPPCACDQYDEDMAEFARSKNRYLFFITVTVAALVFVFWKLLP